MPKNKRQHFLPQHYLRQFRIARTHLVATSVLDPYKFVGGAAINRQCYGDYFYGADGALDALLSQGEIDLAPVLLKVSQERTFTDPELVALKMLAVTLHVRTRKAVEQAKVIPKRMAYEFISHRIETGALRAPEGGFTEKMIDFGGVADLLTKTAIIPCWMEMQTLECKLLEASEGGVFITSDNPVVILNQFAAKANLRRSFVGFSQNGFQLLLPLSPTLCAFFYDPNTYVVSARSSKRLTIGADDVRIINALQVQSAERCLYFHALRYEERVARLVAQHEGRRTPVEAALHILEGRNENEKLLHFRADTVKLPSEWKFCQVRKQTRFLVGQWRDPAWTETIDRLQNDLERRPGTEGVFERLNRIIATL